MAEISKENRMDVGLISSIKVLLSLSKKLYEFLTSVGIY